mmetsp:Transcript_139102/g.196920  ORF Transcript_139102/g.196920 Transcript_139102/m.196920 type:complete len:252 (-) Transcript_139102:483-1238(-)
MASAALQRRHLFLQLHDRELQVAWLTLQLVNEDVSHWQDDHQQIAERFCNPVRPGTILVPHLITGVNLVRSVAIRVQHLIFRHHCIHGVVVDLAQFVSIPVVLGEEACFTTDIVKVVKEGHSQRVEHDIHWILRQHESKVDDHAALDHNDTVQYATNIEPEEVHILQKAWLVLDGRSIQQCGDLQGCNAFVIHDHRTVQGEHDQESCCHNVLREIRHAVLVAARNVVPVGQPEVPTFPIQFVEVVDNAGWW